MPKPRKDQNDRQRAYRQRKAALSRISISESVIDQTPQSLNAPAERLPSNLTFFIVFLLGLEFIPR